MVLIDDTGLPSRQVRTVCHVQGHLPCILWLLDKLFEGRLNSIHLQIWLMVYENHTIVQNKVLVNHCIPNLVFAIYSHGGHLGHVTLTFYTTFHSPFLTMLHKKLGFDWPSGFKEVDV